MANRRFEVILAQLQGFEGARACAHLVISQPLTDFADLDVFHDALPGHGNKFQKF